MDMERLPSGKFETNELVLELAILAYNILRMIEMCIRDSMTAVQVFPSKLILRSATILPPHCHIAVPSTYGLRFAEGCRE